MPLSVLKAHYVGWLIDSACKARKYTVYNSISQIKLYILVTGCQVLR